MTREKLVARAPSVFEQAADAMPTVEFSGPGIAPFSVSDYYVRGIIVDVLPGVGFRWENETDRVVEQQLEFGSTEAQVVTIHLIVKPVRLVGKAGGITDLSSNLTVGVALNAPIELDVIKKELVNRREYMMILINSSPVFSYAENIKAVLSDGAFIGEIKDGVGVFPVLNQHEISPQKVRIAEL